MALYPNLATAPGTVVEQPQGFGQVSNIPGGLEFLATLDQVKVHQVFDVVEAFTGFERNNKYNICSAREEQFLFAKENSGCCTRQCLKTLRPFEIPLTNMQGVPVMQISRGLYCQGNCCFCCMQQMDIQYPPGQIIATIKEEIACHPKFTIFDVNNQVLFRIEGDFCWCKCCTDVTFDVLRPNGSQYGKVLKHWGGFKEVCGRVNDFSIIFDVNEHPLNKAILLGATFLVDFMYFERKD